MEPFRKLCASLPFGFVATDGNPNDPRIVYSNQAFTALTGYSVEETKGRNPKFLQGARTDRAVLDRLKSALRTETPFVGHTYNYRKDGTEFVMEWTVFPLRLPAGHFYCAIQQAHRPGRSAGEEEADRDRLLQTFNDAFRNSLQAIQASVQLLRLDPTPADRRLYHDQIEIQSRTIEHLHLLSTAILTKGKVAG